VVVQDENTEPTHNLDPEMGYRVVDEELMIRADHWTVIEAIQECLLPKYEAISRLADNNESVDDQELVGSITSDEMISFLAVQEGSVTALLSAYSERVILNREVLKAALAVSGMLLFRSDEQAKAHEELVNIAVDNNPNALDFAAPELLMSPALFDRARSLRKNFLSDD
jgi:hypothetical protein